MAVPELMRILLDDANLGWDHAWDLTQRTLGVYEPYAAAGGVREVAARVVRDAAATPPRNHLRDQPASARFSQDAIPRRCWTGAARELDRGRPGASTCVWRIWRSLAHTARTVWRQFTPNSCARRPSKTWPRCFPSVSTTKPMGSLRAGGYCWRIPLLAGAITQAIGESWVTDLSQLKKLVPLAERQGLPRQLQESETAIQISVCKLA